MCMTRFCALCIHLLQTSQGMAQLYVQILVNDIKRAHELQICLNDDHFLHALATSNLYLEKVLSNWAS